MHDWLCHAKKYKPDPHAGGKEHGKPAQIAVVGLGMVGPKLDIPEAADHDEENENEKNCDAQNVEPSHIDLDPGLDRFIKCVGGFGPDNGS